MRVAIFEPFSGIAGDMTLGALLQLGLDPQFLLDLPSRLGLDGVQVRLSTVMRSGIACSKVDFDIPPQPHGRHLKHLVAIVDKSDAPAIVKQRASQAFTAITTVEAEIHASTVERVHLHEVGAVDAILDVVGSLWGLELLGVRGVHSGPISLGDGAVNTAHGLLPVPAPATLKLLEGMTVKPGPAGSGELVTPTGAALLKVLNAAPLPGAFVPVRSGYGAGTKDFPDRPNALRIVLADVSDSSAAEEIMILAADIDDMTPEHLAVAADAIRAAGAYDVVILATQMKKGRAGHRIEVLTSLSKSGELEDALFRHTSTLGVRRSMVSRSTVPRREIVVQVAAGSVRVKVAMPGGQPIRVKAELEDIVKLSVATGVALSVLASEAETEARKFLASSGEVVTTA